MEISYSFNITNLFCYPTYQTLENLVFSVLWDYIGTDGTYVSNVLGRTEIPYDPDTEYTPYENLTKEEVLGWVERYTETSILEDARNLISARIEESHNPPAVINPKLPWEP